MAWVWIETNSGYIAAASALLSIVLLIVSLILAIQLHKHKRRYSLLMEQVEGERLYDLLRDLKVRVEKQQLKLDRYESLTRELTIRMGKMKGHISVIRYNAYGDGGTDLSFSAAMLDDEADGMILTGIHNRENMFLYAKPIEKGQSPYALSPEEKEVIRQSVLQRAEKSS